MANASATAFAVFLAVLLAAMLVAVIRGPGQDGSMPEDAADATQPLPAVPPPARPVPVPFRPEDARARDADAMARAAAVIARAAAMLPPRPARTRSPPTQPPRPCPLAPEASPPRPVIRPGMSLARFPGRRYPAGRPGARRPSRRASHLKHSYYPRNRVTAVTAMNDPRSPTPTSLLLTLKDCGGGYGLWTIGNRQGHLRALEPLGLGDQRRRVRLFSSDDCVTAMCLPGIRCPL